VCLPKRAPPISYCHQQGEGIGCLLPVRNRRVREIGHERGGLSRLLFVDSGYFLLSPVAASSSAGIPITFIYSIAWDGIQTCSSANGIAATVGSS